MKMILAELQNPLIPELPQRGGHGTAVHRQKIRQLLTVQRDVKLLSYLSARIAWAER